LPPLIDQNTRAELTPWGSAASTDTVTGWFGAARPAHGETANTGPIFVS
jgi:hypothetical protein